METMETQLKELATFDRGTKWAKEAHDEGQKVIGLTCSYIPEELIIAAGMFPWHVSGCTQPNTPLANDYHSGMKYCDYCNHVWESFLNGELSFIDGIIITDYDDDRRRLGDVWQYYGKPRLVEVLHVPYAQTPLGYRRYAFELNRVNDAIRGFGGKTNQESLDCAIRVCNKTRELLRKLYQLRKSEAPPLTGAEFLNITLNSKVMPKESFNTKLEAVFPYLERRQLQKTGNYPRVLVSSDFLHQQAYLEAIESCGCVVAMDDFDLGSRYAGVNVNESARDKVSAIADAYLNQSPDARMAEWDRQMDEIIDWARTYDIDGVIELRQIWSRAREMRTPYFLRRLGEASIPAISIEREYNVSNLGQLKTRVGAFLEIIQEKASRRLSKNPLAI